VQPYVHDAVLDMLHARDELLVALDEVGPAEWKKLVPYGGRTLHDLLAHLAGADQAWAVAARGLLKGEAESLAAPLSPDEARQARNKIIERGRLRSIADLKEELERRRKLLLGLFELLEKRHLALALRSYGDEHNSVRERIWLGYHDRLHAADIRRARATIWHPPKLTYVPEVRPAAEALTPDATLYVTYSVDPVQWELPSTVPGWSHRDLLAHIATGDWVLQTHLRSLIEDGHVAEWPNVDEGNAERLQERRHATVNQLIDEYLSMRHGTTLLLAKLKPPHLEEKISFRWEPSPNEHTVLEYLTMFERHERTHRDQLRPAMKYATSLR
jgi:hypothetical protein